MHAHTHTYTHVHPHDKSVVGLSKSEEVFCLKGGLKQRGISPSLFNACWVVVVVWVCVCGGGCIVGWRCVGGGVVEGWMTGQALRNNYLHKIPSPFSFCEGQREQEGEKWQKVKYVEKALVFLLGLAYEELYT